MANALTMPPDAPQDGQPQMPAGNPLQSAGPQPGQVPQQQPQVPAPTHGQTVAALRHFTAIEGALEGLLKNPDIGKASIKSAIIDATTKLVASRILTPAQAVMQLGSVPDDPMQQRRWVQKHMMDAMQGRDGVLEHHRGAFGGTPEEAIEPAGSPDDHLETMSGLMNSHYSPRK